LFDRLRKDYPVRREFQNTQVIADSGQRIALPQVADSSKIVEKLAGIGFGV